MQYRSIKVRTPDSETNIAIQKFLFEKGCSWYGGEKTLQYTHGKFLFVNGNGTLLWGSDQEFFEDSTQSGEYKEVVFTTETSMRVRDMAIKARPKTVLFGKTYFTDELEARLAGLEVAK